MESQIATQKTLVLFCSIKKARKSRSNVNSSNTYTKSVEDRNVFSKHCLLFHQITFVFLSPIQTVMNWIQSKFTLCLTKATQSTTIYESLIKIQMHLFNHTTQNSPQNSAWKCELWKRDGATLRRWDDWKRSNADEWNKYNVRISHISCTKIQTCTHIRTYTHTHARAISLLLSFYLSDWWNSPPWFCHFSLDSYIEVFWSEKKVSLVSSSKKMNQWNTHIHTNTHALASKRANQ